MSRTLSIGRWLLVALIAALPACGDDDPTGPRIDRTTFASSLGVDLPASTRTQSGLYYRDIVVGTGSLANMGSQVSVRYSGALPNGTVFDPGEDPISFVVGDLDLIPGFEEGTFGMRVGGKRQVIIPPELGYGATPRTGIPANSILVFTIELLSVG
jgi:FKBP-type peptidyl-prolyl cis-trans isomerase